MQTLQSIHRVKPRTIERYGLAAACIISPILVYLIGFAYLGLYYFFPPSLTQADIPMLLKSGGAELFSSELAYRERVFLSSIAVSVVSIVAGIYAISTFERNRGPAAAIGVGLLCALLGYWAAATQGTTVRDVVVEWPLQAATGAKISLGLEHLHEGMRQFSKINSFCVVGAASALIARFVDLTLGGGRWDGESDVPTRGLALRETILFGGVLLTITTGATYFYYHYPLALMTSEYAEIHKRFAEIASIRWGALYSAVTITAAAPAIAAHLLERQRLERRIKELLRDNPDAAIPERPPLITLATLSTVAKAVMAFAAMLAPAAISPILEFFNAGAQ